MKLERYIDRKHLVFILITSAISTAILSTFAGLETLRFLSGRNAESPSFFLKLLGMKVPLLFSVSLPFAVFTGITGSYYIMRLNGELMGTFGIGFDYRRYIIRKIPVFILLSLMHFAFNEKVVSRTERAFVSAQASIDRKEVAQKFSDIWLKIGNSFIHIESALPFEGELMGIEIMEVSENQVKRFIKSEIGELKEGTLIMRDAEIVEFRDGKVRSMRDSYTLNNFPLLRIKKEISESDLFSLSISECLNIIKASRRRGGEAEIYKSILHARIILPSMTFVSALLANTTPLFANFASTSSFLIPPSIFSGVVISLYFSTSLAFRRIVPSSISLVIFLAVLIGLSVYFSISRRSKTEQSL